jgi:hypothetical protein
LDAIKLIAVQMIGGSAEGMEGKAIGGVACDSYMEALLSPIFGPVLLGTNYEPANGRQTTDYTLCRWRFTIINRAVRQELLARLEAKAAEAERKRSQGPQRGQRKSSRNSSGI